jgi:hypothetical protein
MKKWLVAVLLAVVAPLAAILPAGAASTAVPYCGITWGSLPKDNPVMTGSPVTNIRSGRHECYDRLVFDLGGPVGGYHVEYVTQVTDPGSGEPIPLLGGAFLQVTVRAPAYDEAANPTYNPPDQQHLVNVTGYRTFRQAAWAGSFEGETSIGLGVRARLPMRVFLLSGPGTGSRVVIDVAHQWSA